jgi:hypothetical protein
MSTSLCDQLREYFVARPGKWIDGHELARLGGYAAWTRRIRDLRTPEHGSMNIQNRTRRETRTVKADFPSDPHTWTVTEYRYLPPGCVLTAEGEPVFFMGAIMIVDPNYPKNMPPMGVGKQIKDTE